MPLKNYSTNVPVSRSVSQITSTLVRKGANQIVTEYNERGQPSGLKWALDSPYGRLGYMLPVNYDAVFEILTNDGIKKRDAEGRMEQAQRVAWRILKDWIESQIALMESGMVCMEEGLSAVHARRRQDGLRCSRIAGISRSVEYR